MRTLLVCYILIAGLIPRTLNTMLSLDSHAKCSLKEPEFLVTFHPHLDAFWLNTDDELKDINFHPASFLYAMNQRNSKTILNSMYDALFRTVDRRYFVTEVVFFKDWYDYLPQDSKNKRQQVKEFIATGQLEICNGGWIENDQSVCYYDDILDQYTLGHRFLYEQFGYVVKIGWATDSFGHSHSQVALLAMLGMEFQGIQRVDDRYVNARVGQPMLQFYWQPYSDSNNRTYPGLVTQVRHFLHEVNNLRDIDPANIGRDFQKLKVTMRQKYGKNKLFRFMGNDFQEFIQPEFSKLENVFKDLDGSQACPEYKYGNPTDYLNIIKDYWDVAQIPVRKYDFIPNWDQDRYWVGYYTTDPELKKMCKDFSRIVNLYRKKVLIKMAQNNSVYNEHKEELKKCDELLSVMQHHDGITATSKLYIEQIFKKRMRTATEELTNSYIPKLSQIAQQILQCKMYESNNVCQIKQAHNHISLRIIHEGLTKKERVQIILPENQFYKLQSHAYDIFCLDVNGGKKECRLVFEAVLEPGHVTFSLEKLQQSDETKKQIIQIKQRSNLSYSVGGVKLSLTKNQELLYEFGQRKFIKISYWFSEATPYRRQTVAWDKYGQKINKNQNIVAGLYIMANNGQLNNMAINWTGFYAGASSRYIKVHISAYPIYAQLTIDRNELHILDWHSNFIPPNGETRDYWLKAESNVVNKQQFFHDSNGYLVAKRKLNWRPDYQWQYKEGDRLNANTYPICSFAYVEDSKSKFVSFVDRSQGVSMYGNGSLVFNIQRLARDDGKGAGQGIMRVVEHQFSQKFGIFELNQNVERIWQRKYDQPLMAYLVPEQTSKPQSVQPEKTVRQQSSFLKYSVFILNKDQVVLRLHNLAQFETIKLNKFSKTKFKIPELKLDLQFKDIQQSFANGNIYKERKVWTDKQVLYKPGSKDDANTLVLDPLQIRSFRISFHQNIVDKQIEVALSMMQEPKAMHLSMSKLKKRC